MFGAAAMLCVAPLALGSYQLYLAQLMMINVIAAAGLNLLTGNCGQISLCHSSFMAIGAYASALVVIGTGLSFLPALAIGLLPPRFWAPASAIRHGVSRDSISRW